MIHGIRQNGKPNITLCRHLIPRKNFLLNRCFCTFDALILFFSRYVYHVHARNYSGFIDAVHTASATEVPGFIHRSMTEDSVRERVRLLMETDWRKEAAVLLEERLKEKEKGGSPYVSNLSMASIFLWLTLIHLFRFSSFRRI